jgi:hypothetical protein
MCAEIGGQICDREGQKIGSLKFGKKFGTFGLWRKCLWERFQEDEITVSHVFG